MNRRDLLKLLLASVIAEAVDVEQLLWAPKPIVTVPAHYVSFGAGLPVLLHGDAAILTAEQFAWLESRLDGRAITIAGHWDG